MSLENQNAFDFLVKWGATIFTILGAILSSVNIYPLNAWVLGISSVFWVIFSIRIKESSLVVVNLGLLIIYFVGVIKANL